MYTVFDPQNGTVKARGIIADKLTSFLIEFSPPEHEPDSDLFSFTAKLNSTQSFVTPDKDFDAWVARGKPMDDLPRSALRNKDGAPAQGTK